VGDRIYLPKNDKDIVNPSSIWSKR